LADVARLAGVSTGSVSRALNDPQKVSAKLRAAVLQAVEELGWVPHGAARALASLKAQTIGAIIPTLANVNFANEINAIQSRLMEAGYILIIGCSEYDPEQAYKQARKMIERGVDGLILLGENYPPALWTLLETQKKPYVITYSFRADSPRPCVGCDNYRALVRLTNYLIELGHRDFAIIAQNPLNNDRAERRLQGALDALADAGIQLPGGRLTEKSWSVTEGRLGLREVFDTPPRPTAVICTNDYLAIGAVVECQAMGLDVPGEVSVVGFDDIEMAAHLRPPLTTMHVPTEELGIRTAEHLISRLCGKAAAHSTELAVDLIVRGSSGPPPGAAFAGNRA
jgi:LacI family transcriptional regulator